MPPAVGLKPRSWVRGQSSKSENGLYGRVSGDADRDRALSAAPSAFAGFEDVDGLRIRMRPSNLPSRPLQPLLRFCRRRLDGTLAVDQGMEHRRSIVALSFGPIPERLARLVLPALQDHVLGHAADCSVPSDAAGLSWPEPKPRAQAGPARFQIFARIELSSVTMRRSPSDRIDGTMPPKKPLPLRGPRPRDRRIVIHSSFEMLPLAATTAAESIPAANQRLRWQLSSSSRSPDRSSGRWTPWDLLSAQPSSPDSRGRSPSGPPARDRA
jgi:hypothetical protein